MTNFIYFTTFDVKLYQLISISLVSMDVGMMGSLMLEEIPHVQAGDYHILSDTIIVDNGDRIWVADEKKE